MSPTSWGHGYLPGTLSLAALLAREKSRRNMGMQGWRDKPDRLSGPGYWSRIPEGALLVDCHVSLDG
jgi:hypothetical protein